jgi:hypothetical protein
VQSELTDGSTGEVVQLTTFSLIAFTNKAVLHQFLDKQSTKTIKQEF